MSEGVFADPQNQAARDLEADALEQLGYQSEAATWRNEYLVGATELRSGVPAVQPNGLNPDMLKAIPLDLLFDFMGIHVNAAKAEGKKITLNWNFTDINEKFVINLENSALTQSAGREDPSADASLTLTRATFDKVLMKKDTFFGDSVKLSGDPQKVRDLLATFDEFSLTFPIVEPLRPAH